MKVSGEDSGIALELFFKNSIKQQTGVFWGVGPIKAGYRFQCACCFHVYTHEKKKRHCFHWNTTEQASFSVAPFWYVVGGMMPERDKGQGDSAQGERSDFGFLIFASHINFMG